mgnify:CR=1 FL=1
MRYDIEEIYQNITGFDVAEALNLDISNDGKHILCLYPDHHDTNFGSCSLQKYGYYCFACSKACSLIDMVELKKGWKGKQGFVKAINFLANIAGVNGTDAPVYEERPPFSEKELELVSLDKRIKPKLYMNIAESKIEIDKRDIEKDNDGYYLVKAKCKPYSINNLFYEDRELYYGLVNGKISEKLKYISNIFNEWDFYSSYVPEGLGEEGKRLLKDAFNTKRKTLLEMKKKCQQYFDSIS